MTPLLLFALSVLLALVAYFVIYPPPEPEIPVPASSNPVPESPAPATQANQVPSTVAAKRPVWKRLLTPLLLFALSVLLALVAYFVIYPPPEPEIPVPASSGLVISSRFPIALITLRVGQVHHDITEIRIVVVTYRLVTPPPQPTPASVEMALPLGATFQGCHPPSCINNTTLLQSISTKPLTFKSGVASIAFYVNASSFGVDHNDVYAYAAVPSVSYLVKNSDSIYPRFLAGFPLPSPAGYDWSPFRYALVTGHLVYWEESLAAGDTPAQTAKGINHARQVRDDRMNFLAGILLGLAGGVVVAAVQEALHASD